MSWLAIISIGLIGALIGLGVTVLFIRGAINGSIGRGLGW
jgi:hypothetical protein